MNIKKILIVIGFFLFVLGIGFALYWVFFRTAPSIQQPNDNQAIGNLPFIGNGNLNVVNTNGNTNGNINILPWQPYVTDKVSEVANGGLTVVNKITEAEASGVFTGQNGVQFYDSNSQKFYRLDENGNMVELSDEKFFQVDNVTWDRNGGKAILEYPDGSNILYNFTSGQQITLPAEMENFSFNSNGNQIAAKWIGPTDEDNWLVAANDDGSGMFLIEPLGDQSYATSVGFSPDNQVAVLHTKYVDAERQEVYPIGLNGENFKSFKVNGAGFNYEWSPEGSSMLYSVYNQDTNYNPNLWVTKGNTSELGDIKVSLNIATWPDKCTFVGENGLYCAVPQGLPRGAGFYPEVADRYPDNFYYIDLNSGSKTLVASPVGDSGSYNAYNLALSPDGSILYFTDSSTGALQSIRIR
ncbi:hypothetical protein KKH39_02335 [Patescibacteria group bacterium]|nr:hypothetical protein [Patescibacteria group bacterium]